MKQKILNLTLLLFCMIVGIGSAWGEETVYKTVLFGSAYNSKGISSYSGTFEATNNNFIVVLQNFNNNNNVWDYVKTGNRNNASVGTIITQNAVDKAITKVVLTIDAITASKVNHIRLYSGDDSNDIAKYEGLFSPATGTQSVTISNPSPNKYYKIEFDCVQGSSNGLVTVSKIEYYIDDDATIPESPMYSVNIDNNINGGAVSSSVTEAVEGANITLTATPDTDYEFTSWEVTNAVTNEPIIVNGNSFVMPSANVNISAVFNEIPTYTIIWSVNGNATTQAYKKGDKINAPFVEPVGEYVFTGWVTIQNVNSVEAPTYITIDKAVEDMIYYAVYAKGSGNVTKTLDFENETNDEWTYNSVTRTAESPSYKANSGSYYGHLNSNVNIQFKEKVKVKEFSYYCVRRTTNTNTSIKIQTSENSSTWKDVETTAWNTFKSDGMTYTKISHKFEDDKEYYVRLSIVTAAHRQVDDISITYGDVSYSDYCTIIPSEPTTPTFTFKATNNGKDYWATFSSDRVVAFDEAFVNDTETCLAEVKAYFVYAEGDEFILEDLYNDYNDGNYTYIPKNTGVLMKYSLDEDSEEFDGSVPYEYADDVDGYLEEVENNNLYPSSKPMTEVEGDNYFYKLSTLNGEHVGFYWGTNYGGVFEMKNKNGAYLAIPKSAGVKSLTLEDLTTAIECVQSNTLDVNAPVYNIVGQRVNSSTKGILIQNGKKYINK